MRKSSPIGIFDSGLGGLTVVKDIKRILPYEDIIYFGDIARLPYGNKSCEAIKRFSIENSLFLINKKVKLIVVACNTASSLALNYLSQVFKVPFIGVIEPVVREALAKAPKRVAVIGTEATIRSRSYEKTIKKYDRKVRVRSRPCPLFVPMIEAGIIDGEFCDGVIRYQLTEIFEFRPEVLLLGCTHYPIISKGIQKFVGNSCEVLSSSWATAQEVELFLRQNDLLNKRGKGKLEIYVSDIPDSFGRLAKLFLGEVEFKIGRRRSDVLH